MHQDFARARTNMVENQVRTNDVTDVAIQDAMREVARERFCPAGAHYLAYAEATVEYAPGWFLATPRDVSKLLQAVQPRPGERALAIAAPYAAAVLARIGCLVAARQPAGAATEAVSAALSDAGVMVESGDIATLGVGASFDLIVCEGGLERPPQAWLDALAVGGRLGVFERSGPVGKARIYMRAPEGPIARREVFDAAPAVMPGFAPKPAFAF